MLCHKTYKFRIYPTAEQAVLIVKTIGIVCFVYNHFSLWNEEYSKNGKRLTYHSYSAMLSQMKKNEDTSWLKECASILDKKSFRFVFPPFYETNEPTTI